MQGSSLALVFSNEWAALIGAGEELRGNLMAEARLGG